MDSTQLGKRVKIVLTAPPRARLLYDNSGIVDTRRNKMPQVLLRCLARVYFSMKGWAIDVEVRMEAVGCA